MARVGRPKSEVTRSKGIFIRVTEEEYESIQYYAKRHGLNITQTLVKSFNKLKDENEAID